MKFFMVFTEKKSKFSFYFIVYTPMHVSDIITNVTKQNMNIFLKVFHNWWYYFYQYLS